MEDKIAIAELVTKWTLFRDQEAWDDLQNTFVPGGRISISWFDGPHEKFVAASKGIAARGSGLLKHQIGPAVVSVRGDKAISQVNVIIMVRAKTPFGLIDTSSYARFYDRLEKADDAWRFVERVGVYEKDRIDAVEAANLPAALYEGLDKYPEPIKFLAKSLASAGLGISKTTILDKSPQWLALKDQYAQWLDS